MAERAGADPVLEMMFCVPSFNMATTLPEENSNRREKTRNGSRAALSLCVRSRNIGIRTLKGAGTWAAENGRHDSVKSPHSKRGLAAWTMPSPVSRNAFRISPPGIKPRFAKKLANRKTATPATTRPKRIAPGAHRRENAAFQSTAVPIATAGISPRTRRNRHTHSFEHLKEARCSPPRTRRNRPTRAWA